MSVISFSAGYCLRLLFASQTDIGAVADLGELFGQAEEFGSLLWEELVEGSETNLTLQEVLEFGPVWLLGIESERILAFCLESRIVPVEVPLAAIDGELLLLLAQTHSSLETVVDTRSIGDDQ